MSEPIPALDLVCLGEAMVEFNQVAPRDYVQGFGGDTSNCAISAARQGARAGYVTRIGADRFGDALLELWAGEDIDVSGVGRDPDAPTGIYFVSHDDAGHHFTYYRHGSAASRMTPADLPAGLIASARLLHVSAISQAISHSAAESVLAAIDIANRHGTRVCYDTNLRLRLWTLARARAVTREAMSRCQIALPSYDDARELTGLGKPTDIVDFYLDLGAEIVVLKLGARGAIAATADERVEIAPLKVDSIDANAAGDTFAGAFLAELARGGDAFAAAAYANRAAALSTTRAGAIASIPTRAETGRFMAD